MVDKRNIYLVVTYQKILFAYTSRLKLICYDVLKSWSWKFWCEKVPHCYVSAIYWCLGYREQLMDSPGYSELVVAVRTGCGELSLSDWPWTWNFSWNKWHVLTDLLLKVSYRENFENMLLLKIQCLVLLTTGHPHICGVTPGRKDIPKNPDCKL